MKKQWKQVLIIILACLCLFALAKQNDNDAITQRYLIASTIMRSDTSKNGHAIAFLNYGDTVIKKEQCGKYTKINYKNKDGYIKSEYLKNEKPKPICKEDGFVYTIVVDIVNEQLAKVDNKILDKFEEDGFSIYATEEDLTERFNLAKNDGHVLGFTSYKTSRILIGNSVHDAYYSTLHELGHWIDYDFDFTSDSKLFQYIYRKEKNVFEKTFDYTITDASELFADGFFHYIDNTNKLKETCPCLYYYLDAVYLMEKTF